MGKNVRQLVSAKMPSLYFKEILSVLLAGESWEGELEMVKKDGSTYWVKAMISAMKNEEGEHKGFLAVQSLLSKKQSRAYQRWVEHARLSCLNECRKILLGAHDREDLYQKFIGNIVERLDYELVYITRKADDKQSKDLAVVCSCGRAEEYLSQLKLSWDEGVTAGQGPAGVSVRTRSPSVMSVEASSFKAWKGLAETYQFRSIACIPLLTKQGALGTMGFYSKHEKFDEDELNFLQSFASELAEGIESMSLSEELRVQNEHLNQLSEKLRITSEAKTRFLANMSHEIRTPLNAIIGFGRLIRESEEKVAPEIAENIKYIDEAGQLLSEVIGNVLDLTKIESGKMTTEMSNLNLHALIDGVYHVHKSLAMSKHLNYRCSIDSNVPQWVKSDRGLLNQITVNLVSNAIKFTESGKTVSLNLLKDDDHFLIVVEDEGIGMSTEQLGKVFNPFEQADTSTRRQYGGTGLGLTLVKQLCELLKGELQVESEFKVGTRFTVRLPLLLGEQAKALATKGEFREQLSMIVVDDNAINLKLMKRVMKKLKIKCDACSSGQEFLDRVDEIQPDFILLDLHMPEMDGLEVLEKMPARFIPFTFMLSADVFKETQQACQDRGVSSFLTKPLDMDHLVAVLAEHFPAP